MKGYDAVDAYRLANLDSLTGKKVSAAKQTALNAQSKEHLVKTGGVSGVSSDVEIPTSAMAIWKDMFPDDTPQKLKERYNKTLK